MILPILIKFEHFQCIFIGCQVKQAAVEQIRCARQASEEACWQCGRPATETCSGISQKQKTNSKTKKKTQKYQFEHFFWYFQNCCRPTIPIKISALQTQNQLRWWRWWCMNIVQDAAWLGIVASCANTRWKQKLISDFEQIFFYFGNIIKHIKTRWHWANNIYFMLNI